MTKEELSQRVAELYGIDAFGWYESRAKKWLHDDSARIFELMCEYAIDVSITKDYVYALAFTGDKTDHPTSFEEQYKDHNNDKAIATRIAILKCLIKMKGE